MIRRNVIIRTAGWCEVMHLPFQKIMLRPENVLYFLVCVELFVCCSEACLQHDEQMKLSSLSIQYLL